MKSDGNFHEGEQELAAAAASFESSEPSECAGCCATESPGRVGTKLKRCLSCKKVRHCSRECQRRHWKQHKRECRKATVARRTGLSTEQLDKPVIFFFVERFVERHMLPLLGSPDPAMWDALFERKGAKDRVHAHMVSFASRYLSNCPEYNTPDAVKRLVETSEEGSDQDINKEPLLSAMQKELYAYLREKENFL